MVAEAAVVGFPHEVKGEGVYAYVILKARLYILGWIIRLSKWLIRVKFKYFKGTFKNYVDKKR